MPSTPSTNATAKPLAEKVVLITGASRGLGRALALAFAEAGADLVLASRETSADDLNAVAREVEAQGARVQAVTADVSDRNDVERLAAGALSRFGHVDVLINNASALGPVPLPLLLDTSVNAFHQVFVTNVEGPFLLTRALIGPMIARGSGLVINVSSDAGVIGYPRWGAYGISKAALDQLTRVWAAELEGTGVAMVSVDPGSMNTVMHRAAEPEEDPNQWADPADIAPILLELAFLPTTILNGRRLEAQAPGLLVQLRAASQEPANV